jgi:peptidoglycan hydrolase-like protein with peptidoglycan-binding domain
MERPGALRVQKTLKKMGYPVEITGIYDESTFRNIMKFQEFFGLMPDGIVGTRTKALLYQMSD